MVIEPLLIDEDYYARVEGREIISNLAKVSRRLKTIPILMGFVIIISFLLWKGGGGIFFYQGCFPSNYLSVCLCANVIRNKKMTSTHEPTV